MDTINATQPAMDTEDSYMKLHAFSVGLSVLAGIGMVIWATKTGRKGRFWWYLLGSFGGGAAGYMIDGLKNK